MIGTTVGKYRIIDRLGRGGMGTVYKAIDETLDRVVAIKVLNPDLGDAELLRRFRAEAVSLAKLNDPGIATIYELHRHDDDLLMVMEFVRGETLQAISERIGPLEPPQAADICIKVLDALAHAHHEGIIHRDLKPANVMMTDRGVVKIMDFGIARMLGGEHFTQTGFMMGTPAYMAPEQVLGKEVDARADLYSVGVLFYRLLARELPFKADTAIAMAQKQVADPPTPIGTFRPDLPPWCAAVIEKALAKDPNARFQTAEEFRAALRSAVTPVALGELPTMATPATMLRTPDMTVPSASGRLSAASTIPMGAPGGGTAAGAAAVAGTGTQAAMTAQGTSASAIPAPGPTTGTAAIPPVERTGNSVVLGRSHLFTLVALIVVLVGGIALLAFLALRKSGESSQQAAATPAVQEAAPAATPADGASQSPAVPPPAQDAAKPVEPPPPAAAGAGVTPPAASTSGQRGGADAAARKKAAAAAKTTEAAPPAEAAAPPPPPVVEAPPPPPPAPAVAPITFKQVKMLVPQGEALKDRDAVLRLAGDHLAILDRGEKTELVTLPYSAIQQVFYSRSKQPKWKGADGKEQELKVDLGKMSFFRGERNWLILTRAGQPVVVRFEDADLSKVLPAFQERSGMKVVR